MTQQALNEREMAAVLAGLRLLQTYIASGGDHVDDVLTNAGSLEPLTESEIDAFCDRLNEGRRQ